MLGLGLALLSVGAINMLIPIIIIIILIGAAGASMRGMSIFDFFGISVLFGIGAHGKGTLAGKNVYKIGRKTTMAKAKDVGKKAGKKAKEKARSALQTWKQNKEETNAEIADAKSMSPLQVKLPPPAPPGSSSPRPGPPPKELTQGMINMVVGRRRWASNAELVRRYKEQRQAVVRDEANINMIKQEIAMKKNTMWQSTKEKKELKAEKKELMRVIERKNALEKNLKDMAPAYEQAKTNIENMRLLNNAVRSITGAGAGFGTAKATMRILQKGADAYPQASPQARLAMEKAKVAWLLSSKARKRGLSLEDAQSAAIQDIRAKLSDINKAAGGNVGANILTKLSNLNNSYKAGQISNVDFVAQSNLLLKDLVKEYENAANNINPSTYLLKSKEWEKMLKKAKKLTAIERRKL
ncbi:MAG: hypothetical protein QXX74_00775 [Candidatus Micrarchaeaceae archaeon]